jgi:uncharacterized protein YjbI with pentapeptide repeats
LSENDFIGEHNSSLCSLINLCREKTLKLFNWSVLDQQVGAKQTIIKSAFLTVANLSQVILSGAGLCGAYLTSATVTKEQLDQAESLSGTIMPDGTTHP